MTVAEIFLALSLLVVIILLGVLSVRDHRRGKHIARLEVGLQRKAWHAATRSKAARPLDQVVRETMQ